MNAPNNDRNTVLSQTQNFQMQDTYLHIKSCYLFKFYLNNTAILYLLQLVIIPAKDIKNKATIQASPGTGDLLAIQTLSLLRNMKHWQCKKMSNLQQFFPFLHRF